MTLHAPAGLPSCRCLAPVALLSLVLLPTPALANGPGTPTPALGGPGVLEHSTGWRPATRSTSCPDTIYLYGGPGTPQGKFQDASGVLPDEQGWTGVDLTDPANPWQLDSFNSPTGTQAAWCGRSAAQEPGWATAPGYGNNWNATLLYESDAVPDPATGQVVSLDFLFNQDTEPGYDYLHVEYEKAGSWVEVFLRDGYTADSTGTHVAFQYSAQPSALPIVYDGGDYAGPGNDRVRIRIRVTSDGAWSDEDGMWPTDGALQVDDISVNSTAGSSFDDFSVDFGNWVPGRASFAGDFFKVFSLASDLDPCQDNRTPVATFIDDGSPVGNPGAAAVYGTDSTGGTTSLNWSYGVFGGWVVNYNGGLSNGQVALNNEMWSPPIAWDLPGTCDDGADFVGATFAFDAYEHLVLTNGIFRIWHVRFSTDGAATWGPWEDTNFVFYNATPRWLRVVNDVTAFVPPGVTHAQLALGVTDLAHIFAFPGADASPSPYHDNVSLAKYRIGGPAISTRTIDLFQDSFPSGGSIDASTEVARDLLDIRIDMARDVSNGNQNVPGDSIIVDIVAVIPGTTVDLAATRLEWVLDRNPLFDSVRTMPAGATVVAGGAANGWDQWRGTVAATQSTVNGTPLQDRYHFDLPDADFLYPGDVLRYYIAAVDDGGRESTLPADIAGFDDGVGFSRTYTVRGLPTIVADGGGGTTQPEVLFINDFGRRGGEAAYMSALGQIGQREGIDFDSYTVQGPSSGVSNGIGGRANADQLGGYGCILYVSGNLPSITLSNGQYDWNGDKGDDIGVLTAWHDLPGDRAAVFFGDNIASDLASDGTGLGGAFLQNILSVNLNDSFVGDEIGGQTNPVVAPAAPSFSASYVASGGCPSINFFDSISPAGAAYAAHRWLDPNGGDSYAPLAASVVHDRVDGVDRKVDLLFPHGLVYVTDNHNFPDGDHRSARASLLFEIFYFIDHPIGVATGADVPALMATADVFPSPFNPTTTIRWASGTSSRNRVVVYDARGRELAVLLDEERPAGPHAVQWDGRDATGRSVASGIYLFEVEADGRRVVRKGVLLK